MRIRDTRTRALTALAAWLLAGTAMAQDFQARGHLDLRLFDPPAEPSWIHGGFGKLRWGGESSLGGKPGGALLLTYKPGAEWLALATVQAQPDHQANIETLEAWLRYRPVSTSRWRWSVRVGAMFPPISLENDGVGWTSPHTITPSAINSWIGEELRSTGIEWRIEHRGDANRLDFGITVFGGNDPAGELLAARGWSVSDRVYGFGSRIREPDPSARRRPPPRLFNAFVENDHRAGWHADLRLQSRRFGQWRLMRYDNRADPSSFREEDGEHIYSWHTRFWSLGHERRIGGAELITQGMYGDTTFIPGGQFVSPTRFWSAFALLARAKGEWRPALRLETFGTRQLAEQVNDPYNELGHALTAALNWRPADRLRLSAEWIRIDSSRTERAELGEPQRRIDRQLQLLLRLSF